MLIHQGSLLVSTHYKGSYEKNNFSWLTYGGNGNPLQYSCQENLMDRRACWATVHGVAGVGHDLVTKPPPIPNLGADGDSSVGLGSGECHMEVYFGPSANHDS